MNTLGNRIRLSRESKGLKQSELAKIIGVKSSGVISNWENDINKPDADRLVALCSALDVTASYLLNYAGDSETILDASEQFLVDVYRDLNEEGKDRLIDYADDLHSMGKYKKDYKPVSAQEKSA